MSKDFEARKVGHLEYAHGQTVPAQYLKLCVSARNFTTVATTLLDRKDKQLYGRQRPILSDAELCLLP